MSQLHTEIVTLRQKVYYIDTSVNTFFNRTIINIQKSLNDLNVRMLELEKKVNEDSNMNNSNEVKTKKVEKKSQNNSNKNNNEIKLIPEMLNLLGSNKENFVKLLQKMNYKTYEKNNDIYFKYIPNKKNIRKKEKVLKTTDNPFKILSQLNLK